MATVVEVSPVPDPKLEPFQLFQIIVHYVVYNIGKRYLSENRYPLQVTLQAETEQTGLYYAMVTHNYLKNVTNITCTIASDTRIQRFDQYMFRKRSITPLPISLF